MKFYLKIFAIALPIIVALDISWIGVIASSFYKNNIGDLLSLNPNLYAAALFYVLYVIALMHFAILPALKAHNFNIAFIQGALLGFTGYMLYDLTNLSTLVHWSVLVTVVDISWGVILSAVTSGLTYILATKLYGIERTDSV